MNKDLKIYGAITLSMIFWSVSFIWFKMANVYYEPITIVFIRLIIAVVLLSSYLFLTRSFVRIRKSDRRYFIMLAVFEPFLYFLGESFGLTYVSSTVGSVLISTIPVFATIGAWLFFREKLRFINYAGILLSFIGVLVFIINRDGSLSFNLKGLALMLVAVLSAVGYNLTLSKLVGNYTPVFIVNIQNIIGIVLFLPVFLIFNLNTLVHTDNSLTSLLPVIELAIFASCGAFILFAYGVQEIGISKANPFTNSIPVFTALFSFILLGDKLTLQNMAGMAIVIAGLFMSQMNGRRRKTDDALVLTGKTA